MTPTITPKTYVIYTDGSFRLPNCGAWTYIILKDDKLWKERSGHSWGTTISRMELTAIVEALSTIPEGSHVVLYSDSQYCIHSITQWVDGWASRGWVLGSGQPVSHRDLMEKIHLFKQTLRLQACWVKAHNGDKYNEQCDQRVQSITSAMVRGYIIPDVPRATTPTAVRIPKPEVIIPTTTPHIPVASPPTPPERRRKKLPYP